MIWNEKNRGPLQRENIGCKMDKDTQVIVTGANGFIGRKLCNVLEKEFNVFKADSKGDCDLRVNLLKADSWNQLEEYTKKPFVFLIHLAFIISSQEKMGSENQKMLENLCTFMHEHQNVFILYPSTALVYGVKYREIITEDYPPNPESLYASVKWTIEKSLLQRFSSRCSIFRLTNVYGSPIKENTVIGEIFNQIKRNQTVSLKDYNSVRDFIYVDDVIESFRLMIRYIKVFESIKENKKLESPYSIFNVSTGIPIGIYDLAYSIADFYNKLELLPEKEKVIDYGFNEFLVPSPKKLEKLINVCLASNIAKGLCSPLRPLSIEKGIEKMIENER